MQRSINSVGAAAGQNTSESLYSCIPPFIYDLGDENLRITGPCHPKHKFYVVTNGLEIGVWTGWDSCSPHCVNVPGSKFKGMQSWGACIDCGILHHDQGLMSPHQCSMQSVAYTSDRCSKFNLPVPTPASPVPAPSTSQGRGHSIRTTATPSRSTFTSVQSPRTPTSPTSTWLYPSIPLSPPSVTRSRSQPAPSTLTRVSREPDEQIWFVVYSKDDAPISFNDISDAERVRVSEFPIEPKRRRVLLLSLARALAVAFILSTAPRLNFFSRHKVEWVEAKVSNGMKKFAEVMVTRYNLTYGNLPSLNNDLADGKIPPIATPAQLVAADAAESTLLAGLSKEEKAERETKNDALRE
ncbi:hypothetical protein BDZ89DRAFT_1052939 [Hymenopellis radicata]|nr:hypothetical protein BDZ89DRAFT_1052939 [Hymenopellis radicata]